MIIMNLVKELYDDGKRALRTALGVALLGAYACGSPTQPPPPPPNQSPVASVSFSPQTAYPDRTLYIQKSISDPDGDPTTYSLQVTVNGSPAPYTDSIPANRLNAGDVVAARLRGYDGTDSSAVATATTTEQQIPYVTKVIPLRFYLDRSAIAGQTVIVNSDTTKTDTNGNATFNFDAREPLPQTLSIGIPTSTYYNMSWTMQFTQDPDTALMIDRYTEPGTGVDKLTNYDWMKSTATTGGLKKGWLPTAWPVRIFANRAGQPCAGMADSVMRGIALWGNPANLRLGVEASSLQNSDIDISYENIPNYFTTLTADSGNNFIIHATIHVPAVCQLGQSFVYIMGREYGRSFGYIEDDTVPGHIMSGNPNSGPAPIESPGMIRMERFLPNLTDMSRYSK